MFGKLESNSASLDQYIGDIKLPHPPQIESMPDDADSRLRAVALHFIDSGQAIIVSYLANGIVYEF